MQVSNVRMSQAYAIGIYSDALMRYAIEGTRRYENWIRNSRSLEARWIRRNEELGFPCTIEVDDWYGMLTVEERVEYSELCRQMDEVYCMLRTDYAKNINRELIDKANNIERREWYDVRY